MVILAKKSFKYEYMWLYSCVWVNYCANDIIKIFCFQFNETKQNKNGKLTHTHTNCNRNQCILYFFFSLACFQPHLNHFYVEWDRNKKKKKGLYKYLLPTYLQQKRNLSPSHTHNQKKNSSQYKIYLYN